MEEAQKIAAELIEQRLAACVNIVPQIISVYRWEGEVCHDTEILLVVKTDHQRFARLEQTVRSLHSYEVPEVIALPIEAGSQAYLKWIDESLGAVEGAKEPGDHENSGMRF
jgi:periplasmic divalent cation tolerance protein